MAAAALAVAALLAGCSSTITGSPVADPGATTEPDDPPTSSGSEPTTEPSEPGPGADLEPTQPGWTVLVNEDANLAYDVPPDWAEAADLTTDSITFAAGASVDSYECGGGGYSRGVVGSTSLQPADPATTATSVAQEVSPLLYSTAGPPEVQLSPPRPVERDGVSGFVVDAAVTAPPDPCLAGQGRVSVLVLDAVDLGGVLQVFLVNIDTMGGPADPGVRSGEEFDQILASARLAS